MGICCVGQAVYDIIGRVDEALAPDTKYRIDEHVECPGGPALNSACVCGLWGAGVSLVARVGDDAYGVLVREGLARFGVDASSMIDDAAARTSFSLVIVNGETGGRTIFNFPSPEGETSVRLPEAAPDVILSDGHEPEASLELMRAFPNAASVVDAGTCRESTLAVARGADYLVASHDFANQYLNRPLALDTDAALLDDLLALRDINHGRVIVTLGSEGLVYLDGDNPTRMPAFDVSAIDSTGAGDIFHGAFAFGLDHGLSMRDCLLLSSMVSAISVTRQGSQTSIPTLSEVLNRLRSYGIEFVGLGA